MPRDHDLTQRSECSKKKTRSLLIFIFFKALTLFMRRNVLFTIGVFWFVTHTQQRALGSGGNLNLPRDNGLCSLHRPLNVYATW